MRIAHPHRMEVIGLLGDRQPQAQVGPGAGEQHRHLRWLEARLAHQDRGADDLAAVSEVQFDVQ